MTLVHSELDDGVLTVTLDDEPKRNALRAALVEELTATLDAADENPDVRVVVLANTGNTFCSGADLSEAASGEGPDGEVGAVVDDLLAGAPGALAATKQVLDQVPDLAKPAAFDWTRDLSVRLFAGEEAREGRQAFREKCPPAWSGSAGPDPDKR